MLHAVTSFYYKSPQEKKQKVFTFIKPENIVHSPNPLPLATLRQPMMEEEGNISMKSMSLFIFIEYARNNSFERIQTYCMLTD